MNNIITEVQLKTMQDLDQLRSFCEYTLHSPVTEGEKVVFGEGPVDADIMFIGEAPGRQEALSGHPFIGNAGNVLEKLLNDIGIQREQVYITNVLKTHPTGNRKPTLSMIQKELPVLKRQIELVRPHVIVLLGATALQGLIDPYAKITQQRGTWTSLNDIPVLITFHPAAVFRDESKYALLERDFKLLQQHMPQVQYHG